MIHDTETCKCDLCRWANKVESAIQQGQPIEDEFGRVVVPCELCRTPTAMTGTKRCDRCWELETRIRFDPDLAKMILARLEAESVAA